MILPLFATALIADATSTLIIRERIYHGLSRAFIPDGAELKGAARGPVHDRKGLRW